MSDGQLSPKLRQALDDHEFYCCHHRVVNKAIKAALSDCIREMLIEAVEQAREFVEHGEGLYESDGPIIADALLYTGDETDEHDVS